MILKGVKKLLKYQHFKKRNDKQNVFVWDAIFSLKYCLFIGISKKHDTKTEKNSDSSLVKKEKGDKSITEYRKSIKSFNTISVEKLNKQKPKYSFIYVGRETCPYCREYLPILKKVKNEYEADKQIYYLDVLNIENDSSLQKIVTEYSIQSIPNLIYIRDDGSFEKTDISDYVGLKSWFSKRI